MSAPMCTTRTEEVVDQCGVGGRRHRARTSTERTHVCSAVYDALLVVWVDAGIERARALSAPMCALPCTTRFGWCGWTPALSAHEH